MNTQFPNNIQGANYITNTQMENARRLLAIPENRNTPAAQNLDKVLSDLNLTFLLSTRPISLLKDIK